MSSSIESWIIFRSLTSLAAKVVYSCTGTIVKRILTSKDANSKPSGNCAEATSLATVFGSLMLHSSSLLKYEAKRPDSGEYHDPGIDKMERTGIFFLEFRQPIDSWDLSTAGFCCLVKSFINPTTIKKVLIRLLKAFPYINLFP